ncbi:conserved hypothetical protein [Paenibacillus curdlanolyticus YK9]|uniref:Uncharacterized protein n=1 Tax=Paenibacillus curdlanolyticus YK9 TaxID=717606 RepID=E0I600_9BACL|nr:hypothetical protein [Paenibacillus curdlanolyticus]EFM12392.1 conserved hypothetical protein [Paenibacillus curdlanolyticus YK9]
MINWNAPILPGIGLGNLRLYSHISGFYPYLCKHEVKAKLLDKFLIRYEMKDFVDLWFNIINGKLVKITALRNYSGKLFDTIQIGMPISEVLAIEPSFEYDEFEEIYCSSKGIYIEVDPDTKAVLWISVFVKEMECHEFECGKW